MTSFPLKHAFLQLFLMMLLCSLGAAAPQTPLETNGKIIKKTPPRIHVQVNPKARTTIYRQVVVLPFVDEQRQEDEQLTDLFYRALDSTGKYALIPLEEGRRWFQKQLKREKNVISEIVLAVQAGKALQTRGIITGKIMRESGPLFAFDATENSLRKKILIQMTDARTKDNVWSLTIERPFISASNQKNMNLQAVLQLGVNKLIDKMVAHGDIFAARLPLPRILSTKGEIRQIRIVLQPDPPHVYSFYRLLRADSPDEIFRPVGKPLANRRPPLILTDTGLEDSTTYAYTVIGITPRGLANIPDLPFKVTTAGPPEPVRSLHVSGNTIRHLQLFWEPSQEPTVNGYVLYRSLRPEGPFTRIATVDGREQQTYIDRGPKSTFGNQFGSLLDNTRYYYVIHTRNIVGVESRDSEVASAVTKGAPPPPSEVRAIDRQPRMVPLTWVAVDDPDVKGYAIFRSTDRGGTFEQIDFVRGRQAQEYIDRGARRQPLSDNTTYFYRIRSVNLVNLHSVDSNQVAATTKAAPLAVRNIKATNGLLRKVQLSWQANPEPDIVSYEIFRGTMEDNVTVKVGTVQAPATQFTDRFLENGRTYWYRIRAVDRDELAGALSTVVRATTKPVPRVPGRFRATIAQGGILLQWDPNPEPDILEYEIFKEEFFREQIGATNKTHLLYKTALRPGKKLRFRIRARDRDGLTSLYSQPLLIRVPKIQTP